MAEIKNPTCPRCGHYLKYKTTCLYGLISLDPTTWEYAVGAVEDEEGEPGIWCDYCDLEITDDDFKQEPEAQDDPG